MKIVIQNIGTKVTLNSLSAIFSAYGDVQDLHFSTFTKATARNRTAHAVMHNEKEGARAVAGLNGCFVDGKVLFVRSVQPERPSVVMRLYKQLHWNLLPQRKC